MPKAHLFKAEWLDHPKDELVPYEELRISNDFHLTFGRKR
jgi:hypothetical protein